MELTLQYIADFVCAVVALVGLYAIYLGLRGLVDRKRMSYRYSRRIRHRAPRRQQAVKMGKGDVLRSLDDMPNVNVRADDTAETRKNKQIRANGLRHMDGGC